MKTLLVAAIAATAFGVFADEPAPVAAPAADKTAAEAADGSGTAQVVLAGTLLAIVQVGVTALGTHDLTVRRHFHALGRALLGLHLRHFICPF